MNRLKPAWPLSSVHTAARAPYSHGQENFLSEALRAQGAPNPPPLRSAAFPLGKPGLMPFHQAKVDSANMLYALAIEVSVFCRRRGVQIIITFSKPMLLFLLKGSFC